jgi:hypothetical protein
MTAADFALGVGSYESPEAAVVEIRSEGVLCQSGQFEEWKEEEIPW